MSKREDIIDGSSVTSSTKYGLIYTCKCGWIDLGHAWPKSKDPEQGAANLWDAIINETGTRSPNGLWVRVTTSQNMTWKGISKGVRREFAMRRNLSLADKESVGLAIIMSVSMEFEKYQSQGQYAWYTDSSFSAEDLVSNLIGFYRTVRPGIDYIKLCEPVSIAAAERIWDTYGALGRGGNKVKVFQPLLFPCFDCAEGGPNVSQPSEPSSSRKLAPLPPFLSSIQPATPLVNFRVWDLNDPELINAPPQPKPAVQNSQVPPRPQNGKHVVRRGDWLSKIAISSYQDMSLWPLIYRANTSVIGNDPDRIIPGQELVIPLLSSFTPGEISEARDIASRWRRIQKPR